MAIVVIGGHSKNVGKTSVVAGLIAAMPEMRWTTLKISLSRHDDSDEHTTVREERDATAGTDSGRFLAAGAVRSLWVRTPVNDLAEAMPRIRRELETAENAVIESNSILRFLRPDLYLSVLDPMVEDFKESARYFLDRADAVLVPEGVLERPEWEEILLKLREGTPVLATRPPVYVTDEVMAFVRRRLER